LLNIARDSSEGGHFVAMSLLGFGLAAIYGRNSWGTSNECFEQGIRSNPWRRQTMVGYNSEKVMP
jgi:hypothetical protein